GDFEQSEAELKAPVAFGRRELEPADERLDRRFSGRAPADVTTERREAAAHVRLIWRAVIHDTDRRKRLQSVPTAEGAGRRVVDHAVAALDAPERRGLAVTDLHEAVAAADTNMFGGSHRHPVPAHAAAGTNTRSRWPSGSVATKVVPKSICTGSCKMFSPRFFQSAKVASTAAEFSTVNATSPAPACALAAGSTVLRDHSPSITPSDSGSIAKVGEVSRMGRPSRSA